MRKDVASARDPLVAVSADPLAPATTTASKAPVVSEAPPTAVEPACAGEPTLSHLPTRPNLSREDAAESGSGAALVGTLKLSVLPDHGGRSDLIAAARRAAQGPRGTVPGRDDEPAGSKITPSAPTSAIGSSRAWLGAIAATLIVLGLLQIARILVIAFDERTTSAPSYTAMTPDAMPNAVPGAATAGEPALAAPLAPLVGRPGTVFSGIDRGTVAAPEIDASIPGAALEPEATGKVRPSSGLTSGGPAARSNSAPAPSGISPDLELAASRRAQ
jgi:hypothetical protein